MLTEQEIREVLIGADNHKCSYWCKDVCAERIGLYRDLLAMREALRPFAKEAECLDDTRLDTTDLYSFGGITSRLTVGDLRKAHVAIKGGGE